jgi:glycosyltransferase involved in cell wall biosynthesis
MINILRIGSHPTDVYNTVAYHAYWLNANPNFNTMHISPNIKGRPLTPKGKTKVVRYKFLNKPKPKKSNIIVRSIFTLHRVLRIITFSLNSIRHLKNQDVVHIHSPMYMIVGFIAKFFGKKVYMTYHGEDFYIVKNSILFKLFSKIFSAVFILSPEIRSELEDIHTCPIIDVNNGVNTDIYKDYGRQRKKQILVVSAFKYQKGHKFMLEAFKEFLDVNNEYQLILVGEGELKEEIKEYCFNNELDKKVDFLGYLTADELVELYNQTEIFVLPSLWEGFPKVLLEAMSCGCKVICTKVDGAVKVLNKDYKYFIKSKDSKGIIEALLRIIKDKYHHNIQSDIAKKYNWADISLPYEKQFKIDLK